jgi:tRNA threonylcarbamoyladenosine biosynthesis protein TsaE
MRFDPDQIAMPEILLENAEETSRLAALMAPHLGAGDVIGLSGGLGAGKSHFARALISTRLAALGRSEEIPSPSYTLVQSYDLDGVDLWHVDLYRLADASEMRELGIEDAFAESIVLVEWIDRLDPDAPPRELRLELEFVQGSETGRRLRLTPRGEGWSWLETIIRRMERPE